MSDVNSAPAPLDRLARLRDDHADRYDPVRFRYLEALARRLAESPRAPTPAQQDKLQQALTDYQTRFEEAREAARARRAALPYDTLDDTTQAQLDHLFESGDLRATRARLHTQKRIDHAIAQTPGDAGPLNAHRLVTRSVETLRGLSPDYLSHFVSYMDTLLALEKVAKKG